MTVDGDYEIMTSSIFPFLDSYFCELAGFCGSGFAFCAGFGGSGFAFTNSSQVMPCFFNLCQSENHRDLAPLPRGRDPLPWPLRRNVGREAQLPSS